MAKRFVDTEKYKKPFLRGLQGPYKVLWDYICLDCNHAGIWIVDFEIAQIYIGKDLQINAADALQFFNQGQVRIIEICKGKKWFIPSFIDFQYGQLNPENRAHKSVIDILSRYNLLCDGKALVRPLQGCKDMDMVKDKVKEKGKGLKRFRVPTLSELQDYATSIEYLAFDPQQFLDFYDSKGWMIGKNKMKDWRAAIRTWKQRDPKMTKPGDEAPKKTRLFPIPGKVCSRNRCRLPAVYVSTGSGYDHHYCGEHMPKEVQNKYTW